VAHEPYYTHQLSLTAYYQSEDPIAVPNTLDHEVEPNQQYRIDVMKPTAALDSIAPADILATVFGNKAGDPLNMAATPFGASLTPFAGQTVRLRMVEVDNQGPFDAGVDAVSILSTPPSNVVAVGNARLNNKKGTAKLPVTVPGPGTLTVVDSNTVKSSAGASAAKKAPKRVKRAKKTATAAGKVLLPITPTGAGRRILSEKHKLRVKLSVSFTPTGGIVGSKTKAIVLKLKPTIAH
jgi:hypothetical protein